MKMKAFLITLALAGALVWTAAVWANDSASAPCNPADCAKMGAGRGMQMEMMVEGHQPMVARGMEHGGMVPCMPGDTSCWQGWLDLTDDQVEKLQATQRPFQKENILTMAKTKVAEIDLADLLRAKSVDLEKAKAKLKELAELKAQFQFNQISCLEKIKSLLKPEQLDRFIKGTGGLPCEGRQRGPWGHRGMGSGFGSDIDDDQGDDESQPPPRMEHQPPRGHRAMTPGDQRGFDVDDQDEGESQPPPCRMQHQPPRQ